MLVAFITVVAATLRVIALGDVPPGLYHDEAFNGLDALDVLAGRWPVYFAANNGREPLFIYLVAATVGLLGRTPGALRLAAAISGTLTIPITYLMARAWFDRRMGLLSAAILATTLWHVHLSRVGFRAVTLPLASAAALWLGARALRRRRRRDWLLAGAACGACAYTYLPAALIPVVLAAFCGYLLLNGQGRQLWPGAAWLVLAALAAVLPLVVYGVSNPDVLPGRTGQVSVFNPLINHGDPWGLLGRQLGSTLGMFVLRGDTIPRHNLPGRPVFDVLVGSAAALGAVLAALRARREPGSALTLIWVGVMLVPTWLSEDAPHFLRAAGVLPVLVLLPARGLDAVMGWLEARRRRRWSQALAGAVLLTSLAATTWDYFHRYGSDEQVAFAFEDAATVLAAEANRFVGAGWDGHGLTALGGEAVPRRRAYVGDRLWREWVATQFLAAEGGGVARALPMTPLTPADATLVLLWPHEEIAPYRGLFPPHPRIEVRTGPQAMGNLDEAPVVAYIAYTAEDWTGPAGPALAQFGGQIALIGLDVGTGEDEWVVRLEWQALEAPSEDYIVFVHLRDAEQLVSQHDGEPALGCYPTGLWQGGDVIVDPHTLSLPQGGLENVGDEIGLAVGLYRWPSLEHLESTTPSGELLGNEFELPVTPDW